MGKTTHPTWPGHNKRLARFTLRGTAKVRTQWQLFCLARNIEKLAHSGWGHEGAGGAAGKSPLSRCHSHSPRPKVRATIARNENSAEPEPILHVRCLDASRWGYWTASLGVLCSAGTLSSVLRLFLLEVAT